MAAGASSYALTPGNWEAEGEITMQWEAVRNAVSYTVNLYKQDDTGKDVRIDEVSKVYGSSVTSVDITDVIKTYGPGEYMCSIVAVRRNNTTSKSYATVTITQLAAPTGVTVDETGLVRWTAVDGAVKYKVTVTAAANGETLGTETYEAAADAVSLSAADFVAGYKDSDKAVTVSATVVAVGSLSKGYRTLNSESSSAGVLPEQAGVLPTPVITSQTVASENGRLYLTYGFEGGSVPYTYVEQLTLTLTHNEDKTEGTYTVSPVAESGRIDVTELTSGNPLPTGQFTAVLEATPKYPALNEPTSSTSQVFYGSDELLPPVLTVNDAGTEISWPQVALNNGKLDDVADYTIEYKETGETDWKTVSIPGGDAIQMKEDGTLYTDISPIVTVGGDSFDFRVTANNEEDLTIGKTSSASITVVKTYPVSDAAIDAAKYQDKVYATWTNPADTTGIAHYRVDVYENGALKQSFTTEDASVSELDISSAIRPSAVKTYTVQVTAIGSHDQRPAQELFYADSAVLAGKNEVTSGTVEAANIVFEDPEGASTSYVVNFAGGKAELPENVKGYQVTISYVLPSGAKNSWSGTIEATSCDITKLNNGKFMSTSNLNEYVNAEFTVTAITLSSNTALHKNAAKKTATDTFALSEIDAELLKPYIETVDGKTYVNWSNVPGANDYKVTVQRQGATFDVGRFPTEFKANITSSLGVAGEYTVTVTAQAIAGSTVYMDGSASVKLTVLAEPVVTITTAENDTAKASWEPIEGASYLVTVLKDGVALEGHSNVATEATEYDLTEIIKTNGQGTYTVQVTAVGDGSAYITSLTYGSASVDIHQIAAPSVTFTVEKNKAVVTVTPQGDYAAESYTVNVYAGEDLAGTTTVAKDGGTADVTDVVSAYKDAAAAVSFRVEVVAVGNLGSKTLSSGAAKADLQEKAGNLPAVEITSEEIAQENGMLVVNYKLTDTGVGLGAIGKITLKLQQGGSTYTYTKNFTDGQVAQAEDFFDVSKIPNTETGLPGGEYTATITVTPVNNNLNTSTSAQKTLVYDVETLPNADLKVTDDGSKLYWAPIQMTDGKAVDEVTEFQLAVKADANSSWQSDNIGQNAILFDHEQNVFYVDLTSLLNSYSMYQVKAFNNEDATYTKESEAEITIAKLQPVTNVQLISDTAAGVVKATWTDSANTEGLKGYKVELLKQNTEGTYEVVKTYETEETSYTIPGEDIDENVLATYSVRVTALGTKSYEGTFYADSTVATTEDTLISGSVPTVVKTGAIYEQNGKLYLKVDLLDENDSYSKIDTVVLSRLTGNGMTYTTAVTGELHPAAGEANAYVVFDLSEMNVQSLMSGTWKATVKVNSQNEALNASTSGTVTIVYNVEALDAPALTVDPETGAISWPAVPGAAKYQITVSYDNANPWTTSMTASSGDGETITYNIDDQTFSADGGMKPGRVYTVEVVAQNDTSMTTPDSQPGTIQVCKIEAPTGVNLNITKTAAQAKWTKSATTANAVAAYEITAVNANGAPIYTKTTATGKVAQQNLAAAGLLNNAAENGIYTVQVRALAADSAVSGVYYVNSDVVAAEETAVKGRLPASDIANVALAWVENNQLQLSFQLPQITDGMSDYEKAVIEAIDTGNITVTTYSGNSAFGVYSGDTVTVDESGRCTVNVTTGNQGDFDTMPFANVKNPKVMIKLTSNYKLIYAANMARTAVTIPEQGVISFDGFVVDYEKATLTFPTNPNATYTAKLTLDTTTTDLTVADAKDGAKVVGFSAIEAGKDYTLTIEGTDPSNVYQPGTLELHLYKLQTPKSGNINSKTGVLSVTADAAADAAQYAYTLSVSGKYDASSETKGENGKRTGGIVSFNLKKPAANVDTVITLIGGACTVGEETIHVINSDAYTVTKFVGQLPEVALTSSAIAYNTDKSNSVTFSIDASLDSFAAKENVVDWSSVTVSAVGSDQGTAVADSVSYDAASHTITATFGEGKLRPTVGYTFTVSLKVAANQVAFAGDRDYTTTEPISYSIDALTLTPTVASNGYITWNLNAADAVEKITVKVDKSASYDVTDVTKTTNLFSLAKIANDNTVKHTFEIQALAKEGSGYSDSAVVTIYAQRLNSVQVTVNSDGTFTVNTNRNPRDSYSYQVALTGSVEGSYTYRSNPTGSFITGSTYKWAEGPFQTIKAVTTTSAASSGVAVKGVFYLNAYEKFTVDATDFYVGQLPAVTLTPASGALNLDADGNLTLAYALAAGVDPALYSELNLSMVQEGFDGTITIEPITAVAANGTFNLDAVKALQGTFNTTLTAKAANPVINSNPAPVETSYSYNTSALATPVVEVDYAKGTLTWAAVEGAASYEVSYGDNPTVVYSGTETSYQPTAEQIAAGAVATFKVTAISDKEQVLNSTPAVVTLYRLKTPVIRSFNTQTGVLSITTDSVADKAGYAYTVDVTKSSLATETKTTKGNGTVSKTYTFNLTRDAYQASFTVKLTGGYDAESQVHVLNAATYATTKVYAGKLPALTLDTTSFTEAADGTLSVTFTIPETVDSFKYGTQTADVIDFIKSTITAKAGVSSVDGAFGTAADGKVTATFDGDFIVRDVAYQFEITLVPSNTYKAVAGESSFTTDGTASIAGTAYAKPEVTMKPDGTFNASELPEGTKLQVSLDGVTYYDIPTGGNVFDVLGDQMTEAKEYTLYFRVAAASEASGTSLFAAEERDPSAPITITVVRLAAPVISIDEEAKTFTVTADAINGTLVVKLDGEEVELTGGSYDYSTAILSGSFTVTAYVDASEGTDPIYLDSAVATAEGAVSGTKLTAPRLSVNVTRGTIVWTADDNAAGYSIMVGEAEADVSEVVFDENTGKYTYTPDLEAGDYFITIQALGGDNTGYADSDVTTAYVTKMPDVTSVEVHMADDPDTDGFQSEVYINHDTDIQNAYANAGISVTPSNKTVATWDKATRVMTYTNDGEPVTLYVNASVGGASVNDETYGKHYFFRPDVYSMKSDKFTVGILPDFELVSVVSDNAANETYVTFAPVGGEDVSEIMDLDALNFGYGYKNSGEDYTDGSEYFESAAFDENGNLIATISGVTGTAYDLQYTFDVKPVHDYSATRGAVSVEETFYYAGNQLAAPENLRVEMIDDKATLVWDEVEGATGYTVHKENNDVTPSVEGESCEISIEGKDKDVTYTVVATADGCADSEAAALVVHMVSDTAAELGFNAKTPVSYSNARVNFTLTGTGVESSAISKNDLTTSRLRTLMQFVASDDDVTVTQSGSTYTVEFKDGYLDEQQTFELTAYLCGQYKDVWYFSNTAATTDVTVGKVATGASLKAGSLAVTGRAQNVQVTIENAVRTCIDTANIQVSVIDSKDESVELTNTSYSVNSNNVLTLKFAAGALVAGETYTVYIDLPSRYPACGTGASLQFTFTAK